MKPIVLLLLSLLLATACQRSADRGDLLDRDTFRDVLVEAQLIEARQHQEMTLLQLEGTILHDKYDALLEEQGIDRERFIRTFDHYTDHPKELHEIYEEVLVELQRRKDLGL